MPAFAARYAKALAEIVTDPKTGLEAHAVDAELDSFAASWSESPALRAAFVDPSISAARKIAILDRLAERLELSKTVRNFLAVLSNHERMEAFPAVLAEYRSEMRRRLGIAQVEVTTARPLDEGERRAIVERIGSLAGAEVEAAFYQDESLLGGALLRIGSTVYDGTVLGRLEQLKEKLAG